MYLDAYELFSSEECKLNVNVLLTPRTWTDASPLYGQQTELTSLQKDNTKYRAAVGHAEVNTTTLLRVRN